MNDEKLYLVYRSSLKGTPMPEIWYGDQLTGTGLYKHKSVGAPGSDLLAFYAIKEEHAALVKTKVFTLSTLVQLYPYVAGEVKTQESKK